MMNLRDITIAADGTHHLYQGKPLYSHRFCRVLKFHSPGLAPVEDESGAFHISINGEPAYEERFQQTFGYYFNRAAVILWEGWSHIDPNGNLVYQQRYIWVGNYQDRYCTVREQNGYYFHIDLQGNRPYSENYLYSGDFHDGVAVVRLLNGFCTHIDFNGKYIHGKMFLDLDVYHKGYARARQEDGWFHINLEGKPTCNERFLMIEPFYNGQALVHRFNGEIGIIDEQGIWIHSIIEAER